MNIWELLSIFKENGATAICGGILDRTHLRFFTKKSILALYADSDLNVDQIKGINANWGGTSRKWLCHKIMNGLTLSAIEDMKYLQFAVVASPFEKIPTPSQKNQPNQT